MKLLLVALLVFPLIAEAMCEREETLYANSINLYVKTKKLNDVSKQLFQERQISKEEMVRSFKLLDRTLDMVHKSQHLYYECKARTMV